MKKILIIDDEPDMIEILRYCLEACGYEIITATDGVQGYVMAQDEKPDLIVLDIMMPNLDGCTFVKLFSPQELGKDIPIVIITGKKELRERFQSQKQVYFFSKPFQTYQVVEQIRELVKEK